MTGIILQMEKPDVTLDELMRVSRDRIFLQGGIIIGQEEIINAYEKQGKIIVRAKVDIEKRTRWEEVIGN